MNTPQSIFLSASIVSPEELDSGLRKIDTFAVRDALIAFIETVFLKTNYNIIWGGHPTITKLITYVLEKSYGISLRENADTPEAERIKSRFLLYQSSYFKETYPPENNGFKLIETPRGNERTDSLTIMRRAMLHPMHNIIMGVFMGGKIAGLKEEEHILKENHPNALRLPLGRTGGYSHQLYTIGMKHNTIPPQLQALSNSYRFYELFKKAFIELENREREESELGNR